MTLKSFVERNWHNLQWFSPKDGMHVSLDSSSIQVCLKWQMKYCKMSCALLQIMCYGVSMWIWSKGKSGWVLEEPKPSQERPAPDEDNELCMVGLGRPNPLGNDWKEHDSREESLYLVQLYNSFNVISSTSTFKTSPKSVRMLLRTITNHFRILPDCKTQGIMEKSQRDLKHIRSKKCLPNSTIFSNDKTVVCNLSLYINCFIIFVIKFYTKFKKKPSTHQWRTVILGKYAIVQKTHSIQNSSPYYQSSNFSSFQSIETALSHIFNNLSDICGKCNWWIG